MDKAGFSGKQQKSVPSVEDIPEALRDNPKAEIRFRMRLMFLVAGLLGLGAISLVVSLWFFSYGPGRRAISASPGASSPTPAITTGTTPASTDTLLGHFSYAEAPANELQPMVVDRRIKLRKAAAQKFQEMAAAAGASGVVLIPISGFRSIADQEHVFFDLKSQRAQTAAQRAEVSAPPGYSEHHTGYAIDVGDGMVPATNLNPNFDKTKAFEWLLTNAVRFNFEMSFPKNNPQGVSYEPWHWRFVGDRQSLETFYKAKNFKPASPPTSPPTSPPASTPPS